LCDTLWLFGEDQRLAARHQSGGNPLLAILTARTVAFHKYTIMEHLGLKTSAELVQYVREHGVLKKRT